MKLVLAAALALFALWQFNPYSAGTYGDVVMWDDANGYFNLSQVSTSKGVLVTFNKRRSAIAMATGGSTTFTGTGYAYGTTITTVGTPTGQAADASNPVRVRFTTGGSTGNEAGIQGNQLTLRTGRNMRHLFWGQLGSTANVRQAMGLTDQASVVTMVSADNPAGNYAYFRFSTDAGDTTWRCITKDGTTQNIGNTNVTADTNGHKFEIRENTSAATWTFYIDQAEVCSLSSNLPSASTNMTSVIGLETRTGSAKSMDWAWLMEESDK